MRIDLPLAGDIMLLLKIFAVKVALPRLAQGNGGYAGSRRAGVFSLPHITLASTDGTEWIY